MSAATNLQLTRAYNAMEIAQRDLAGRDQADIHRAMYFITLVRNNINRPRTGKQRKAK